LLKEQIKQLKQNNEAQKEENQTNMNDLLKEIFKLNEKIKEGSKNEIVI